MVKLIICIYQLSFFFEEWKVTTSFNIFPVWACCINRKSFISSSLPPSLPPLTHLTFSTLLKPCSHHLLLLLLLIPNGLNRSSFETTPTHQPPSLLNLSGKQFLFGQRNSRFNLHKSHVTMQTLQKCHRFHL